MNRRHYTTHPQQRTDRHGLRRLPADYEEIMAGQAAVCKLCRGRGVLMTFDCYGDPMVDGLCPNVDTFPELHRRKS